MRRIFEVEGGCEVGFKGCLEFLGIEMGGSRDIKGLMLIKVWRWERGG